ncbi:MAG: DUF1513 domain-containing protein [Rhodoferax sp.]|uniref:DUF1513 domain-containing protein n=1 Tax=Rhodoferax sp. TaxID=50421 RepID=UPI002ACE3107|nr:DUF1513 domain-containing protein [Rhodoferax sp.]MDZ7892563.1 DUF1513 domain-containing protein [Rhodoferax sp.]
MATDPAATRPAPTRRQALGTLGVAAWSACLPTAAATAQQVRSDTLQVLTAWQTGGRAYAGVWTPQSIRWAIALPNRAHQLLPLSARYTGAVREALVVARRPGEYLARVDTRNGRLLHLHTVEVDRYLGGHAVKSPDGRFIFTTESDGDTGQGLIAQRHAGSLETIREFPSGGIGPHALMWEPGGQLIVANGGILTLPETGRRKRNLPQMASNLTRLDSTSGSIVAQFALDDPYLSLRHLALAPDGTLAVALQAEHSDPALRQAAPALALLHSDGLHALAWPADGAALQGWQGYAGDVCWAGDTFWVSATHAGQVMGWSTAGEWRGMLPLAGAGALMPVGNGADGFMAGGSREALSAPTSTSATGSGSAHRLYRLARGWDNHGTLLSI